MSNEEAKPVTREELATLPPWAIVAFAARCANRVQPLFDLPDDLPNQLWQLRAVDDAIRSSERYVEAFFCGGERAAAARASLAARAAAGAGIFVSGRAHAAASSASAAARAAASSCEVRESAGGQAAAFYLTQSAADVARLAAAATEEDDDDALFYATQLLPSAPISLDCKPSPTPSYRPRWTSPSWGRWPPLVRWSPSLVSRRQGADGPPAAPSPSRTPERISSPPGRSPSQDHLDHHGIRHRHPSPLPLFRPR